MLVSGFQTLQTYFQGVHLSPKPKKVTYFQGVHFKTKTSNVWNIQNFYEIPTSKSIYFETFWVKKMRFSINLHNYFPSMHNSKVPVWRAVVLFKRRHLTYDQPIQCTTYCSCLASSMLLHPFNPNQSSQLAI